MTVVLTVRGGLSLAVRVLCTHCVSPYAGAVVFLAGLRCMSCHCLGPVDSLALGPSDWREKPPVQLLFNSIQGFSETNMLPCYGCLRQ